MSILPFNKIRFIERAIWWIYGQKVDSVLDGTFIRSARSLPPRPADSALLESPVLPFGNREDKRGAQEAGDCDRSGSYTWNRSDR